MLPLKVRDEVVLADWVHTIVIPTALRETMSPHIPQVLRSHVVFVENDCKDIWDWSEKVYSIIEKERC